MKFYIAVNLLVFRIVDSKLVTSNKHQTEFEGLHYHLYVSLVYFVLQD